MEVSMKSNVTLPSARSGEVWQLKTGSYTRLYIIVGQSPRLAYRIVDLMTGKWDAVNHVKLDGNSKGDIDRSWTRVS
jgi:hypothetical protein